MKNNIKKQLTIKNIGPIKNVSFDIKKVNVFMGKQSSGKSTIAKILSFCSWVEKDISFHQSYDKYEKKPIEFIRNIEIFHKMKGYFRKSSEICYIGDAIKIHYFNNNIEFEWLDNRYEYKRPKISYIPSERSVIILPEMEKVELPNNYLKSYLYDWLNSRRNYTIDRRFSILDTNVNYYFSEEDRENHIESNGYDIVLSQSSSGLQSVVSLLAMVDDLTINLYNTDRETSSYELDSIKIEVTQSLIEKYVIKPYIDNYHKEGDIVDMMNILSNKIANQEEEVQPLLANYRRVRENLFKYHRTNLIIEEPEQNLFPSTQKELAYKLLEYINSSPYDHIMTLTTHSPYILYAINNCILAHLVKDKYPDLDIIDSAIAPKDINIFEIEDGEKRSIMEENGLIGDNYFDQKMKEVMDDFYQSLNYL